MYYYYVYIISNWNHNVFYTGFTNDLGRRIREHKIGLYDGFSKKYKCNKLLYYELYHNMTDALHREKQIKRYRRAWKLNLIATQNPNLNDLYDSIKEEN